MVNHLNKDSSSLSSDAPSIKGADDEKRMAMGVNVHEHEDGHGHGHIDDTKLALQGRLRVDLLVVSCLIVMFVFLQFDRTSLGECSIEVPAPIPPLTRPSSTGNALTDNFSTVARLSQADINLGQTLFTLGMVLFEIPSNVAIKRIGAHRLLPILMFCWGTVTWCQMFIRSRPSFLALRFLLAMCEAGFIPGAAFYLGQFFTRRDMAFRYTLLWAANSIAGALAGVLALGLLSLNGRGGLHGWQWLWLIEGVLTCAVAVAAALHLPSGLAGATRHPLFGRRLPILTEAQAEAIDERVTRDDPTKASQRSRRVRGVDFDVFVGWKVWGHCLMAFLSSIMFTPVNTYAPSIIKSLGFRGYSANGLNSVGSVLALVVSLSLSFTSDRMGERALLVFVGFCVPAVGLLWLALPPDGVHAGVLYAGLVIVQGGMGCVQGINAVGVLLDRPLLLPS